MQVANKRARRALLAALVAMAVIVPITHPVGAGATQVRAFGDNFNGTLVSSDWAVLDGNSSPHYWSAKRVSVSDGMLHLRTAYDTTTNHWESGAVVLKNHGQAYGKWAARVRCSVGYSKCLALLWPDSPTWPPEIDFYEIFASDYYRRSSKQTLHYKTVDGRRKHWAFQDADFTRWHTVAVKWAPGRIDYLLDGHVTATMTNNVPTIPMHLNLSTSVSTDPEAHQPTGPVAMDVDWVMQYTYG